MGFYRRDTGRLIRYTARGAGSLERLAQDEDGDLLYPFTRVGSDGTRGIQLTRHGEARENGHKKWLSTFLSVAPGLEHLMTKGQKGADCLGWFERQETCDDGILALSMVMLREGLNMLPPAMRRVIVPVDRAIYMLSLPMMRESSCLDLRPPEIHVTLIRQHHT